MLACLLGKRVKDWTFIVASYVFGYQDAYRTNPVLHDVCRRCWTVRLQHPTDALLASPPLLWYKRGAPNSLFEHDWGICSQMTFQLLLPNTYLLTRLYRCCCGCASTELVDAPTAEGKGNRKACATEAQKTTATARHPREGLITIVVVEVPSKPVHLCVCVRCKSSDQGRSRVGGAGGNTMAIWRSMMIGYLAFASPTPLHRHPLTLSTLALRSGVRWQACAQLWFSFTSPGLPLLPKRRALRPPPSGGLSL